MSSGIIRNEVQKRVLLGIQCGLEGRASGVVDGARWQAGVPVGVEGVVDIPVDSQEATGPFAATLQSKDNRRITLEEHASFQAVDKNTGHPSPFLGNGGLGLNE